MCATIENDRERLRARTRSSTRALSLILPSAQHHVRCSDSTRDTSARASTRGILGTGLLRATATNAGQAGLGAIAPIANPRQSTKFEVPRRA